MNNMINSKNKGKETNSATSFYKYVALLSFVLPVIIFAQTLRWAFVSDGPAHQNDEVYKVIHASDGYIYAVGYQTSASSGKDICVMKFSSSGVHQWSYRTYWTGDDIGCDIVYGGSNIYVGGYATGNSKEYVVLSLNTSGNERWSFISDGPANQDDEVRSIAYGGGYVYSVGYQTSSGSGKNICVMKFSSSGVHQWSYRTYWTGDDIGQDIVYGNDNNLYVGGYSSGQGREFVVLSIDPSTGIEESSSLPKNGFSMQGYPNPMKHSITLSLPTEQSSGVNLEIYDESGKLVKTLIQDQFLTNQQVVWDGKDEDGIVCSSGVYFCKLKTPEFIDVMKIIKLE